MTAVGRKRRLIALATVLGLGAGCLAGEFIVRAFGYSPWIYRSLGREPQMLEPDAEIGWVHKPGQYAFAFTPPTREATVTLLNDGDRATSNSDLTEDARPSLWLLGCSYTEGWALSDASTYAWKLQSRFPNLRIRNFGTAGYGTYQSLLMLERQLKLNSAPTTVVYGFIQHHEVRNAASVPWLKSVAVGSKRGHVAVPYALLGPRGGGGSFVNLPSGIRCGA